MNVLMIGVDKSTQGGMWTVAENFINDVEFCRKTNLKYMATSITGSKTKRILFTAKSLLKIGFELVRKKYDIVHVHMSEKGSVYRKNIVINMARFFRCKIVLHMHGAEFEIWYKSLAPKKQKGVRKIVDKADKILILGYYWIDFMQSLVTEKSKVAVLYNAVDIPKQNSYNSSACHLLFLGAICQRKGIYDLLQAINLVKEKLGENVKLWIYGPDFDNNIDEKIADLNLGKHVEYKGWLGNDERKKVFSDVSVNILPSYNEGLPMTILETMAYGIPNITTNVAAIPEAVNNDNGILIEPGDIVTLAKAILELSNDLEIRKQKSNAAYLTSKNKFCLQEHLAQMERIYEELI